MKKEKLMKISNKKNWQNILLFFCFIITPLICCEALCLIWNTKLTHISTYGMAGNDEVIYYKMIEGTVKYGMPLGYFGYNESHALVGTYSTWSPILLLPWAVFGWLFGWEARSPIIYNIVMLMLSMGVFYVLVRPNMKKALEIISLYTVMVFVSWYALAILTEITCYSLIIVLIGLFYNIQHTNSYWKLKIFLLFLVVTLLTWMRPYYFVLLLLPNYELIKCQHNKIKSVIISVATGILAGGGYFWISKNMCAPYFTDLVDFSLLKMIFLDPVDAIVKICTSLISDFREYLIYVREGILGVSLIGAENAGILLVFILLIIQLRKEIKEKKYEEGTMTGIIIAFILLTFCAASLLFTFTIWGFSRHFAGLILLGTLYLTLKDGTKAASVMIGAFVWLFYLQVEFFGCAPYNFELDMQIRSGNEQLNNAIAVSADSEHWDNTVIWVLSDDKSVSWQELFAIPAGMGINLCTNEYIVDNWESLNSKYLYTSKDGTIDSLCEDQGAILLADYGEIHVWKLRD